MPSSTAAATEPALITASYGRQFLVRLQASGIPGEPAERVAVTRGKRTDPGVGDTVLVRRIGPDQAVIESVQPRTSEVRRSDRWRSKLLAANVGQVGIVLAGEPPFSEELALRILCACATAGVPVALIANKSDLVEARAAIEPRLAVYRALGVPVFDIAAGGDPLSARETLSRWLAGQTTLLVGQSGMGKSTLINTLVPDADLRTQAISSALASGKHTTTFSRLFDLPQSVAADARIIDTPGFQSFGITHLSTSQLIHSMPEFGPLLGRCRFNDCSHRDEPGCAIRQAVEAGAIDGRRFELYGRLVSETITDPSMPRP